VDKDAPLAEFEKIAAQYPVFRVPGQVRRTSESALHLGGNT
jgi:hypothetical protein